MCWQVLFPHQRKGASGLAKHDNMHVCVSFGTHSLGVCVYPCWSSILISFWKPWWKFVRMCRYWSSSSRGRLGYLSSHGVLQPKHTFFCLGLGCAYQSSKNIQSRVLSELSEWKTTPLEFHCEWRCFTNKLDILSVIWMEIRCFAFSQVWDITQHYYWVKYSKTWPLAPK